MDPNASAAPRPFPTHVLAAVIALLVIPMNGVIFFGWVASSKSSDALPFAVFTVMALLQFAAGISALVLGVRHRKRQGNGGVGSAVSGGLLALGAAAGWFGGLALFALSSVGGAWGRPLRIRGRQLHPNLKEGADWTGGERPDPAGLDEPTRAALEALWLHDAQKEHASVPAFARISWLLAAVGAPAELLEWAHRAGLEEIDHTRRCFALAAGYAGRSFTVEPMPELLLGGLEVNADPLVTLAVESLADGCQLEDFNADVAARCAAVCEEPATRKVLEQIAREERTHADFSWAVLEWVVARDRPRVLPPLERALAELEQYPRPTAVSREKLPLVARANPSQLRRHGRLDDAEWGEAWVTRLAATRARARGLFEARRAA